MYHARKSLLFSNEGPWMECEGNLFDITMETYDCVDGWELVDNFMLNEISEKYNKIDIGLFRNNGLAVFQNISGPK